MKPVFYALAAIAFWSTNAVVARTALSDLPVALIQVLQYAGACGVFAVAWLARQKRPVASSLLSSLVLGTIGLTGTMVLQYMAFAQGPIADVNIVAYAWPLLAALGLILRGRIPRPHVYLPLTIIGFLGAGLVIFHPQSGPEFGNVSWGHIAAIGSAICMAVYTIAIGDIVVDQDFAHLSGSVIGILIALFWCVESGVGWVSPTQASFWMALYLGIGPIGVGYLLWARAMARDPSGQVSMLGYLTPVVSTGLLLVTGETFHWQAFLGACLVVCACTLLGMEGRSRAAA